MTKNDSSGHGDPDSQPLRAFLVPIKPEPSGDGVDIIRLWEMLASRWLLVVAIMLFGMLAGTLAAFLMTPIYRAQVLMASSIGEEQQGGLSSLAAKFGGIASLTGINLNSGGEKYQALAVLKSRKFTVDFIESESLMPILFSSRWDAEKNAWHPEADEKPPSIEKAFRLFDKKIRFVSEDSKTGHFTLAIEWSDRELAAAWANLLVKRLNEHLRKTAIAESEKSFEFLKEEARNTSLVELRQGIYSMMQGQIEAAMLANVREEYAFKILDPAIVADPGMTVRPRRILLIALGLFVGLSLGVAVALIRGSLGPPESEG